MCVCWYACALECKENVCMKAHHQSNSSWGGGGGRNWGGGKERPVVKRAFQSDFSLFLKGIIYKSHKHTVT